MTICIPVTGNVAVIEYVGSDRSVPAVRTINEVSPRGRCHPQDDRGVPSPAEERPYNY
ncbi:hypothetical protein [Ruminococcus sp.]|uniref:hypothetical protein n=1 Tax=Ruminococcus sp. TaxID=41978 RepID=UPI00389012D8